MAAGQSAPTVSALPPTQLTAAGANQASVARDEKPQARSIVAYADGKITVDAANASLNQVLRDIAQKTGMKVSGGVSDEKVFGHFGPSPIAEVLATLLDGTGSNMLLVDRKDGPLSLILSPRRGGVTPPNPNAAVASTNDSGDQQEQYVPPTQPFQPPVATGRGPIGSNADGSPAFGSPNQDDSAPNSGETPKTPQQIYEQLQSLGAQQQATTPEQ